MKYLLDGQETTRLQFRLLDQTDFDHWLPFFEHPGVAEFVGMQEIPTPLERCERWFQNAAKRYQGDLGGLNALIDKATNELVGQSGLLVQIVDGRPELEVAYSILPRFWGKGYATEAAIQCRDFAFENDFADTLISIIHVENIGSEKVALKNGMKKLKRTVFKDMPVNVYHVHQADWKKMR